MRRTRKNILKGGAAITIGASVTAQAISQGQAGTEFAIEGDGMRGRIDLGLGSTTKTNAITFKFQTAACRDSTGAWIWQDVASATVPATSVPETALTIYWNPNVSGLEAKLPCGQVGRVTCTTGASDSVVINSLSLTECLP
jgi:hypothetical protein